ncbi:hypothetical protein CI109_101642 [Kwoniella shandongensis]|uniref:AB hydrolase-1 domain-containing protein n=1 Tax=Kwoniella shandongensis TaxID=1734106 RepID=A0AAJ8LHE2_9TREE
METRIPFTTLPRLTLNQIIAAIACLIVTWYLKSILEKRYQPIKLVVPLVPQSAFSNNTPQEKRNPEDGDEEDRAESRANESTEEIVETYCKSLKDGFRASWWLPNGHAQTIYSAVANFNKDDHVTYQRQLLELPDGGTIGIDIFPPLSMELPPTSPVIIINHGLTGGSHESYIRNIVVWLTKPVPEGGLGARAAVVNFRGCASTPLTSHHLYSSGNTIDTHTTTTYMASLYPDAPLFGVGFSLGAGVMTRYLGEHGADSRLQAAVVLCCPLQLRQMSAKLDSGHLLPRLYSISLALKMVRSISPHLLPHSPLSAESSPLYTNIPEILSLASSRRSWFSIRASKVIDLITTKVGGSHELFPFDKLDEFLEWACPGGWIGKIKRPTLAISALDDPILAGDCLPYAAVHASSHFVLAAVPQGGHLGWFEGPLTGPDRHRRWHVKPVLEFFRGVLQNLPEPRANIKRMEVRKAGDWNWVGDVGWKLVDEQVECA